MQTMHSATLTEKSKKHQKICVHPHTLYTTATILLPHCIWKTGPTYRHSPQEGMTQWWQCSNGNVCYLHATTNTSTKHRNCKWCETGMVCGQ